MKTIRTFINTIMGRIRRFIKDHIIDEAPDDLDI